jgi:outer membrane protein assembly factor BamD
LNGKSLAKLHNGGEIMKKRKILTALLGIALVCGISPSVSAQLIKKPAKKPPAKAADTDANSSAQPDKILYDRALEDIKHGRFTEGRLSLQTLINTYPDSEYLAKAKLAVADSYFKENGTSNLTQAVAEYKDFITFFPFLEEAAYAQMQVGMAHYKMMEKADRDNSQAQMAEDEFQAMLLKFPQSPLAPQAEQRLREVQEVLADGEYKIAHYYYAKQDYRASAARLLEVVNRYPLYSQSDEALWMLGDIYSRVKLGSKNEDQRNYWGALSGKVYAQIVEQYPLSLRAQDAKARLKQMGLPVPASNPDAVIRMQKERDYEKQHHESALLKTPKNMLHGAPDVSLAAHVGQPNLNPPDDAVAASEVLKPNSGGAGFALSASAPGTGGADSSASSNSNGPTKQDDTVTSQGTIDSGPAPGRTLGVQIIQPPDASAPSSASTGAAATSPAASTTNQRVAPSATAPEPAASPASSASAPTGAPPSTQPAGSNGQPAGTQAAAQTDQSSTDSSSSSANGQTTSATQSSSTDDSKDSTSKKKKGARKLIPW